MLHAHPCLPVPPLLQAQPSTRLLGVVPDLFSVTLGARGLALLMAPILCPLSLAPHLALAAFAVEVRRLRHRWRWRSTSHAAATRVVCRPACPHFKQQLRAQPATAPHRPHHSPLCSVAARLFTCAPAPCCGMPPGAIALPRCIAWSAR